MPSIRRKFTLFHMSLLKPAQSRLDEFIGTRADWIRHSLKNRFTFQYWGGRNLHWVPVEIYDHLMLGVIQREVDHVAHQSPDDGGLEFTAREWQGAYVVVDPRDHEDGQKVAVENDVVGKPESLIRYLVANLNNRDDAPYVIEVEPLFDSKDFWEFSERHNNTLRYVRFNFVVPNMWGAESEVEEDIKEAGRQTGAQRISTSFSGKGGVNTKNKIIHSAVEYAHKGAGTIRAKSQSGENFFSEHKASQTEVEFASEANKTQQVKNNSDRILGRG